MRNFKRILKNFCMILPAALVLSACAGNERPEQSAEAPSMEVAVSEPRITGIPFDFLVDPEYFTLSASISDTVIPLSQGSIKRTVTDYMENDGKVSWRFPEEQISVSISPMEDYLSVAITSESDRGNTFAWPDISAENYYIPFGEGKRVPASDSAWINHLEGQEFSVLEQLSMPFWISTAKDHSVLFVMENPYRTQFHFSADPGIAFTVSHDYPEIAEERTNHFRIYLTDSDPVNAAKLYRGYVTEKGNFMTLEEKAEKNPDIRKLYGAPFIYLWGDFIISAEDINWKAFRQSLSSPVMDYLASFADQLENGQEYLSTIEEIKTQDYVAEYQKNIVCGYISQLLKRDDFWNPDVLTTDSPDLGLLLSKGYENLSVSEKLQACKYALAASLPQVFSDAALWMNASTTDLLHEMKEGGIEHAWIGLNSWEQAYAKPELVDTASEQGYLIASYDSYHSIHEPGKEQWITAKFDDPTLYEDGTVTDRDGNKVSGFKNVGRKLNPALSLPSVKNRMESIMANQLPFNSWFIDCDATGEIYDDYTPSHITTQEEDLAARLERMAYIRDQYNLVIGSEGGHDFAASDIAFAHGIELKSFSWMDDDMKSNKDSEFYIGKYYNPNGGVAEHFSKRIPVKNKYYAVFADPVYDIPLFKLVYNDSVITSCHWDWSTFKIVGATADRMIREVLLNVPPLYHLDADEWSEYKEDIISHQTVWSDFSQKAITREMVDFKYLAADGSVQKTVYGTSLSAVANYSDTPFHYEGNDIPPHSVLISEDGENTVYTPSLQAEHS